MVKKIGEVNNTLNNKITGNCIDALFSMLLCLAIMKLFNFGDINCCNIFI